MSEPERRTVRVAHSEYLENQNNWPAPTDGAFLSGVIEWFQRKLEEIPEEYRASAKCTIDTGTPDWDYGPVAQIEIWYERPETDEEYAARVAQIDRAREIRERTAHTRDRRGEATEIIRGLGPSIEALRKKGLTE